MFEHLKEKFPLPSAKYEEFAKEFKRIEVPAKTILLQENEVSLHAYYIEKGIARAWYNNDGKDVTFQFFLENTMFSSLESFKKGIPSMVSFETIEPCVLLKIDKQTVDKILEEVYKDPTLRNRLMDAIFERTFDYMKHFFSFIKDSPQQRYLNLTKEKPELIKRISQHYIASYLGITTVHLSRIKSKIVKESQLF